MTSDASNTARTFSDSRVNGKTRAAADTLVIRDSASLQTWRRQLRAFTPTGNLPAVLFQLPELSPEQNRSMSALADGYRRACGCTSGGFFMSATVVATAVSYFASGGRLSDIYLKQVVSFLVITAVGALSGKLLGLLWARWRLWKLAAGMCRKVVRAA